MARSKAQERCRHSARAHVGFSLSEKLPNFVESLVDHFAQLVADFVFTPEEPGDVLHPFEIADDNAAAIRENVGHTTTFLAFKSHRLAGGGAIRAFDDDLARTSWALPL